MKVLLSHVAAPSLKDSQWLISASSRGVANIVRQHSTTKSIWGLQSKQVGPAFLQAASFLNQLQAADIRKNLLRRTVDAGEKTQLA